MSSSETTTQVSSKESVQPARIEQAAVVRACTITSSTSGRFVVTRKQQGELKLRYSPIEAQPTNAGQTTVSS
jgi:hypothetical protein